MSWHRVLCSLAPVGGVMLTSLWLAAPALSEERGAPYAVTFFAGQGTDTDFTTILTEPWTVHFVDLGVAGAAISARLGTVSELTDSDLGFLGEHFSIDLETGAAYRFGDETAGEFWGAAYLRYDGFPWNDIVYTTVAANTGVSYITNTSEFERSRSDGQTSLLLHYLAPEITFANPDYKNLEFLIKLHHRSGVFGAFDGVTGGSTFVGAGIRFRFD